ncbi:MerR family transcriptional regulator [Fodinicola feengrottensis]|uniref:MerR family transcriptional regulator n=1 Tax=Fodinicola feengrottensis TaxID=435914 RepID=UPI0031E192BE
MPVLIGELAALAGVSTRMLRYYDQQGLLASQRSSNGYRRYDETDLRAVRQIRTLVENGFALEETRPFVDCLRAGYASADVCAASQEAYVRKLADLDDGIDRLQRTRADLAARLAAAAQVQCGAPACEASLTS